MYANTCWGLLGLAVSFGLAVLGLPHDYAWLGAYLLSAAAACGVASFACFCWPLVQRQRTVLRTIDRIDGWSVSARLGTLGALPQEKTIFFQKCRFVNVSNAQHRIVDLVIHMKIGDFQTFLRTEDQGKTQYRLALDKLKLPDTRDRIMRYIDLPIQLPPAGIVEGQLEFAMSAELAEIFSNFNQWAGKISASIKMIEHRSGRETSFRYGYRYDAIRGREVRKESIIDHLILKMRAWRNVARMKLRKRYVRQ